MLVLSRKKEEAVIIGHNIRVTVLEIRGNRVRLGFQAPDSVTVHRSEIHEHIQDFGSADGPIECNWNPAKDGTSKELVLTH